MTRDEAVALWRIVLDNGFSASLNGGIHDDWEPQETYCVEVHVISLGPAELRSLATIGENNGVGLRLLGARLAYLDEKERPR